MALPKGYHIQMVVTDEKGEIKNLLPVSVAEDVKLDASGNSSVDIKIENLQQLVNALGKLAFLDAIPESSTEEAGIVQLSNKTDDKTATSTAATTAAVSEVAEVANGAVQITGDEDVDGVKNFSNGITLAKDTRLVSETDEAGNVTMTIKFS